MNIAWVIIIAFAALFFLTIHNDVSKRERPAARPDSLIEAIFMNGFAWIGLTFLGSFAVWSMIRLDTVLMKALGY